MIGNTKVIGYSTKCHTMDHFVFYIENNNKTKSALFSGDCFFSGSTGRFFEGNAKNMYDNINKIFFNDNIKEETKIFPGVNKYI